MLKLGVNIDHVATIREARYRGRGFGEPDPAAVARICEAAGAHGITAHLREDRRHIQDRDVWKLREIVKTRLNLEMANAPEIISIALKLKPDIVCIVPERRLEVTTEGGLDVVAAEQSLTETRKKMNDSGIEVSLFIAPDEKQIEAAARTGSQFIELHTGQFSEHFCNGQRELAHSEKWEMDQSRHMSAAPDFEIELQRLISGARQAHALRLKVNAGHGLNYENLPLLNRVPHLVELNIGHSIVSRAALVGMESAVREMLALMKVIKDEMILGTGIDIIEVARIASSFEKFGERFVNRILLPDEITYCLSHRNSAPFLAARFAAKEAISKAFGTGIGAQLGWQDMEIRRKESGEPFVILHGKGRKLFESRGAKQLYVSLSHTQNYAAATAILES